MNGLLIGVIIAALAMLAFAVGLGLGWLFAGRRGEQRLREIETQVRAEGQSSLESAHTELSIARTQLIRVEGERDRLLREQADRSALDDRLAPLRESVDSLRKQAQLAEVQRAEAASQLREQITGVQRNYVSLETATRQLVAAMSTAQSRGQWGEMQLEQLLEYSGLVEGVNFTKQATRAAEANDRRPDVIIHLPGGGEVFVDAKFPFDAYWRAIEAGDSPEADAHFKKHAADVLGRVVELAKKKYWESSRSPDFVVMFLPLESLLASALDVDGDLLNQAFNRNVVLATPTSMLGMLRTISFGYQRKLMADNAEEIRAAGAEMLGRLETAIKHLNSLQRGLGNAVDGYNRFVASFDSRVMPQARRMKELGVVATTELDSPTEINLALSKSRTDSSADSGGIEPVNNPEELGP